MFDMVYYWTYPCETKDSQADCRLTMLDYEPHITFITDTITGLKEAKCCFIA